MKTMNMHSRISVFIETVKIFRRIPQIYGNGETIFTNFKVYENGGSIFMNFNGLNGLPY